MFWAQAARKPNSWDIRKYSKFATFGTAKSLKASAIFVLAAASFEFPDHSDCQWTLEVMATPAASQCHYCEAALYDSAPEGNVLTKVMNLSEAI